MQQASAARQFCVALILNSIKLLRAQTPPINAKRDELQEYECQFWQNPLLRFRERLKHVA